MLVHCPICPSTFAEQILSQYKVTARKDRDSEVGALATYRCRAGHVFFVRVADLVRPGAASAEANEQRFGRH